MLNQSEAKGKKEEKEEEANSSRVSSRVLNEELLARCSLTTVVWCVQSAAKVRGRKKIHLFQRRINLQIQRISRIKLNDVDAALCGASAARNGGSIK